MPKVMEIPYRSFGDTVQLYITPNCGMNCPHCRSQLQTMCDMTLPKFREVVRILKLLGVKRIELFANDPLLHPQIQEFISILNESGLGYALLTVGASPTDSSVGPLFLEVAEMIDRERGGIVFSVDCTEKTARAILSEDPTSPYAFKAMRFWELAEWLQTEGVPVRVNIVISRNNIDEVALIIQQVAEMGFAVSFCFVQFRQPEFDEVSSKGLTPELEQVFRQFMSDSGLLSPDEIDEIVAVSKEILGSAEALSCFNAFRGEDSKEGNISPELLAKLRNELLELKSEFGDALILPGGDYIRAIGDRGSGCLGLLEQGCFPQMKIAADGGIPFCCDLHDFITRMFSICDLITEEGRKSLLEAILKNPFIWLCIFFNRCAFSVNYVQSAT